MPRDITLLLILRYYAADATLIFCRRYAFKHIRLRFMLFCFDDDILLSPLIRWLMLMLAAIRHFRRCYAITLILFVASAICRCLPRLIAFSWLQKTSPRALSTPPLFRAMMFVCYLRHICWRFYARFVAARDGGMGKAPYATAAAAIPYFTLMRVTFTMMPIYDFIFATCRSLRRRRVASAPRCLIVFDCCFHDDAFAVL